MPSARAALDPKPEVLFIRSHGRDPEPDLAPGEWDRLNGLFTIHHFAGASLVDYRAGLAPGGPWSNVSAIIRTGWLKTGPFAGWLFFGPDEVPRLPSSLQLVACTGHGYDAADVPGLAARGIAYSNTPDTCTEAVANTALYLVLASYRYFSFAEKCARGAPREDSGGGAANGTSDDDDDDDEYFWGRSRELGPKAEDPVGHVLGIVGMGDIGAAIARKAAAALGMRVHYHNRTRNHAAEKALEPFGGAEYHDSLESLLAVADCICLACPLTPLTKHAISRRTLGLTKAQGVRIVNIGRGGLIDEDALLEALESRRVIGVGLDVHAQEPGVNPKLKDNWMVTLLPHIGVCSGSSWREFDRVNFRNLEEWFYGDKSKVTTVKPL